MANVAAPRGFIPVQRMDGAAWTGQVRPFTIASGYATTIGEGDLVKQLTDGTIAQAAAGDTVVGVFLGVEYTDSNGKRQMSNFWPASTTATAIVAKVVDDPFMMFEAEFNGASAATLANVGANYDIAVSAASTADGLSRMSVDLSTLGTVSAQVQMLGFVERPDNDKAAANPRILVRIVEHFRTATAGV